MPRSVGAARPKSPRPASQKICNVGRHLPTSSISQDQHPQSSMHAVSESRVSSALERPESNVSIDREIGRQGMQASSILAFSVD